MNTRPAISSDPPSMGRSLRTLALPPFRGRRFGAILLVVAASVAYHNSFSVPFVFDDLPSIVENETIRDLGDPAAVLSPPADAGQTVSGRPLANLSFALNYAVSGNATWSYHALNLLIHACAGLALLGVVRRTLLMPALRGRFDESAFPIALGTALLWVVHPLQTESVTYVVQRTEALASLFILLTFYCHARGIDSRRPGLWQALSVTACIMGAASKEIVVAVPLLALLYDRAFVSGSFVATWRQRWKLLVGLAGSWVVLLVLVFGVGGRAGTAGLATNASVWDYALTQARAVTLYLRLTFWPDPLVFDYGTSLVARLADVLPEMLLLAALAGLTGWLAVRRPALGFPGVWFFALLAPSSSIVPIATQTIAEHRMYLPLAAVAVLAVAALHAIAGRLAWLICLMLAPGLGWLTIQRNETYHSELALWGDTVTKQPGNPRAHLNYGLACARAGRADDAQEHFEDAVRLAPTDTDARNNLGIALARAGRTGEAVHHYREAIRLHPANVKARLNLANLLAAGGAEDEAVAMFQEVLRLTPGNAGAHADLARTLLGARKPAEALPHLEEAVRLRPWDPALQFSLGNALASAGRMSDAVDAYRRVVSLAPDHHMANNNLGNALLRLRRYPEATSAYRDALRIKADALTSANLGTALLLQGKASEAIEHFTEALRLDPDYAPARTNLERARLLLESRRARN